MAGAPGVSYGAFRYLRHIQTHGAAGNLAIQEQPRNKLRLLNHWDRFNLEFPNLTVKKIFTEYFNELEHIEVSLGYTDMFPQFLRYPELSITRHVACTIGATDHRFFTLG